MRPSAVGAVYRKEMLDLLRDRRATISMIVAPVLVIPLLFQFLSFFMRRSVARQEVAAVGVAVTGADRVPGLLNAIAGARFQFVASQDARRAVERRQAAAGVEAARLPDGKMEIRIYADHTQRIPEMASERLRTAIETFRESSVRIRLYSMGVPEEVYQPFEVKRVNLAESRKVAGSVWGTTIGCVVVLLMFFGGMYPAIDSTVGEKERRTLEALLSSPAGRSELALGKTLAVASAVFATGALSVASFAVSAWIGYRSAARAPQQLGSLAIDPATLLLAGAALLPAAAMTASVMIALALYARSVKEAQSYLTPVLLAAVFPVVAGLLPGVELSPKLALVPVFNVSQLLKEIFQGEVSGADFAVTAGANLACGAAAFYLAVRAFRSERVLFRQ